MRQLLSFLALAFVSQLALAIDCSKAVNTLEINECASIKQKKIETQPNTTYQEVLKSLEQQTY